MSNQGFSGFLIKKTSQPYSLRQDHTNFNQFKNSNLTLYINKKVGDLRERTGRTKLSKSTLCNTQLTIKPQTGIQKKEYCSSLKLDNSTTQMLNEYIQKDEMEDFCIETLGNPAKKQKQKNQMDINKKLEIMINNETQNQNFVQQLFEKYKRKNLQTNLNQIKMQKKQDLSKDLRKLELNDDEQVDYFMEQVCGDKITIGSILGVEGVEQRKDPGNLENYIIEKRLRNDQLQKIMEKDEIKKLVKIYQQTKLELFEPQLHSKSKLKMLTMKRKNELQEQLYDKQKDIYKGEKNQEKYKRVPDSFTKKFSKINSRYNNQQQLFTRPQSGISHNHSTNYKTLTQAEIEDFFEKCKSQEKDQNQKKKTIEIQLSTLQDDIQKSLKMIQSISENPVNTENDEFKKFKQLNQFKKKLTQYMLKRTLNKSQILSQKVIDNRTQKFIQEQF